MPGGILRDLRDWRSHPGLRPKHSLPLDIEMSGTAARALPSQGLPTVTQAIQVETSRLDIGRHKNYTYQVHSFLSNLSNLI